MGNTTDLDGTGLRSSLQASPLLPSMTLCARPVPDELPVSLHLPAAEDLKNFSMSTSGENV